MGILLEKVLAILFLDPSQSPVRIALGLGPHASDPILLTTPAAPPQIERHPDRARIACQFRDEADRIDVVISLRVATATAAGTGAGVTADREIPEVLAELRLHHTGPRTVRQVVFPYVVRHTNTFDRLLMASAWGDDIPQVCQTLRAFADAGGNVKRMGMPYIDHAEAEAIYYYPSIMAMQHMVLYNAAQSLYVACYGTDDATKTFHAKALAKYDLALSIAHYPFLAGEGDWVSPACSVALLGGGWHPAADLYASHMRPQFRQPDLPEWMRRGFHGWIEVGMKHEGHAPRYYFRDLVGLYRDVVAPTGCNVMAIYGWANTAHDCNYPDYQVNEELGTAAELKAACDEVRRLGGRIEFYTNMRLVDPDSDFYRAGGDQCICLGEDGAPYIERYATSSEFRIACPACPPYREYFAGQVRRMIEEYGAGAMQVDQTSCNLDYFCFDATHPHPTPATNFLPGLEATLRDVRAVYQSLDPGFYVWGEGCHERFGQFYDVHQGHGEEYTWQMGRSTPEHFQFVYPDAVVTGHAKTGYQGLCHSHAQGKPFDVSIQCMNDPDFARLLPALVAVRAAWPQYFFEGVFRDDENLVTSGGVRAFALWRPDRRGLLVNLWLPGASPEGAYATSLRHPAGEWPVRGVYPADLRIGDRPGEVECCWTGPLVTLVFEDDACL